ncbi:hypothetical protein VV869_00125 [Photobacterium sp. MCCC 1A19761]|uniref:hypothetical protein n=1 Tax=Photobacterium sp. MCCC 1A19761 TaxID=3115000 RepID=UPI00307E86F6
MFIRGIQSQLNLKPHFYAESAKVGGVGCLLGSSLAYYLCSFIASYFGISADVPIRSYDGIVVLKMFSLCFLVLVLCLYVFCALSAFVYYGFKFKKGLINKQELINIVFKSLYPERWQNGL